MSGRRKAKPFGCPLDGRVRSLRVKAHEFSFADRRLLDESLRPVACVRTPERTRSGAGVGVFRRRLLWRAMGVGAALAQGRGQTTRLRSLGLRGAPSRQVSECGPRTVLTVPVFLLRRPPRCWRTCRRPGGDLNGPTARRSTAARSALHELTA